MDNDPEELDYPGPSRRWSYDRRRDNCSSAPYTGRYSGNSALCRFCRSGSGWDFLLVLRRLGSRARANWWAAFAAVLLVLTVVDYFWYTNLVGIRTETWNGRTIVCGTELRPEIRKAYGASIPKSRVRELLEDAAGEPGLIWTDQSLRWSKDILCISYLLMVPLIGGCIVATSQIAVCLAPELETPGTP